MRKQIKKLFLLVFLFLSTKLFANEILYEDLFVTESVKNLNLGGHSIIVDEGSVIIEKCTNGEIIISSNVGPGMITKKNCQNVSVTLECSANILIDKKTKIKTLCIKNNANINSLEAFQAELKNKSFNSKKLPVIENVFIEENLYPVIQNIDFQNKKMISTDNLEISQKLRIKQDYSYKGYGVRFLIENFPKDADCLYVLLYENGTEKEIEWISPETNKNRFYSGYYDYEFVPAGKLTEFIFWYAKGTETLTKYYIKAKAKKGINVSFDNSKVELNTDGKTGLISWKSTPQNMELPEDSHLVYEMISLDSNYNWHYIGNCVKKWNDFADVNLYKDFDWTYPDSIINDMILIHVYFAYKTYRWQIIKETPQFTIKGYNP